MRSTLSPRVRDLGGVDPEVLTETVDLVESGGSRGEVVPDPDPDSPTARQPRLVARVPPHLPSHGFCERPRPDGVDGTEGDGWDVFRGLWCRYVLQ